MEIKGDSLTGWHCWAEWFGEERKVFSGSVWACIRYRADNT